MTRQNLCQPAETLTRRPSFVMARPDRAMTVKGWYVNLFADWYQMAYQVFSAENVARMESKKRAGTPEEVSALA